MLVHERLCGLLAHRSTRAVCLLKAIILAAYGGHEEIGRPGARSSVAVLVARL